MPGFPASYTLEVALKEIAEIEKALQEGHPPHSSGTHHKGCHRIAAERLNTSYGALVRRHGFPEAPGPVHRKWGVGPNWSMYKAPAPAAGPSQEQKENDGPPADHVEVRRWKDKAQELQRRLEAAERRAAKAEDLRGEVFRLKELAPAPIAFPASKDGASHRETIVLFLSDLHWGEFISLSAMDGLNSYSVEIARARLARWAQTVIHLGTKHWNGPPPERIMLILGGDLISGGIHYELATTDQLKPLPAVRDVSDHLRSAILAIKKKIDCPIDVISIPGNHSRSTLKFESKDSATTSYDMLVSDFLEAGLKDREGITFYTPESPDALFSVYSHRVLATHGDRCGSRGGQGFIGPAATAARGFKKITADYAARKIHLDLILIGHFHTALMLDEGFVNGCLCGPSEYSRDGRFRPRPASQLFLTMHPRRTIAQIRWIEVGDPAEGSLYAPPPLERPLQSRYGVDTK